MNTLFQDITYGLRMLHAKPTFAPKVDPMVALRYE